MIKAVTRDLGTRRFWGKLGINAFAALGFAATVLGLFDLVAPDRIGSATGPVGFSVVILAAGYGSWRAWPRPVEQQYSKPNTKIRIVVGDLFDQDCNLVIGMTTTFDTEVPHIIQRNSIQGQFLARVYHDDIGELNADIESALDGISPTGLITKPGKQVKYESGTVVVLRQHRKHYFCVAYSEMDEHNQAQATVDGMWQSLSNLWTKVRAHANGDPIAIAVIGGGLSRLSQVLPAQDAIRVMILSFIFASRYTAVCERLDIVVQPRLVPRLDMLELQDFLESLRES